MERRKIMRVTNQDLLSILSGKARIINIPDGSKLEFSYAEPHCDSMSIIMSNPEFRETESGHGYGLFYAEVRAVCQVEVENTSDERPS